MTPKPSSGVLSNRQILSLSQAEFRGTWRRFIFFIICIAIGVGAVMTIKSFSKLLDDAVKTESKALLAADIALQSSWEQSPEDRRYQERVLPPGTEFVFLKELHAMARIPRESPKGFHSLLVELKAVPRDPPHYPLYGKFKARPDRPLTELLAEPGAVVDPSFLLRSGRKVGDSFFLGKIQVTITGTVVSEPDRISRAFSIGPRVFVSRGTLDAAGLVQPGSRVKHRTLIGLPPSMPLDKGVALLERGLQDRGVKIRTYKDMESSLTDSIERMEQYLGSMAVIALLLGGIGVAMIIRTFMAQKLDTIAILKCLGMSSRTIFKIYLFQSFFLGMTGSLLGVTLGYALQFLLPGRVSGLLNVTVEPRFYWMPAAQSLSLGLAITLLFCVWPLLQAVKTRPLRLFRRSFEEEELASGSRKERWGMGLAILMGLAMIVFWQAESVRRGLVFLLALGIAVLVLRAVSGLLLKVLKKMPPPKALTRRYGLANLHRPNSQAVSIVTCLGLGIMLVLTVRLVQLDMVDMLKANTEIDPPNYFFIDIQPDQKAKFVTILDRVAPEAERNLVPLVRARFHSIDGRRADDWQYKNKREEEWFINREFVLTYRGGAPPPDNEILQGEWWGPEEASVPQVSLEEDAARRLGADIGSQLTMEVQGVKVTVPVTSIRQVDWRNMRTNFFMIFSPGALQGAPHTFVATVHVPDPKELDLQHAVVEALPNVTALSTRDIIRTVENVTEKLKTLVDFMSLFSILAGLFILSGSVASTKFRRLREGAILKILGAKRKTVSAILGVEYVTLGVISGLVGVGLSLALSWAVMEYLVRAPWTPRPAALAAAWLLTILLTTLTGTLSSLDVLNNKPFKTLRKLDA